MKLEKLLSLCLEKNASDLHLSSGMPPVMRIDGDLVAIDEKPLEPQSIQTMLDTLMNDDQKQSFATTLECDFALSLQNVSARFRVNVFKQHRGPAVVFRMIPQKVLKLGDINAPEVVKSILKQKNGLILVTGPTGSGKSTTLAAMIDYLNDTTSGHIISVEDPIEFIHQSRRCLVNQREVKQDTLSFNNALSAMLREDPDYILIGEMRDLETIRMALTAAETGHLVFATLHTASAPKTIDRIINVFPGEEQSMIRTMLAESLHSVISQRLLKRKSGSGRIAAYEILIANSAIRNLIRENKLPQIHNTLQTGQNLGMQTMEQAIQKLGDAGVIETNDARNPR